ncbi:low molecular weight phosphatase family protein [Sphingobacterium sp. Mn56C]|uniref:arsenate-mycothiol transferase ArsC n=1 Tax=Sphingobacterium sp. Mn56C TaxID=3395261 RepID=UPI003BBC64AC
MYSILSNTIRQLNWTKIEASERRKTLAPLIAFIQDSLNHRQQIQLLFICTHNSRRSHLSQVWAQVAAAYFGIPQMLCYSGGTEETALSPTVVETLSLQGFVTFTIHAGNNPVYAIKYKDNHAPIIGFSKRYDSLFNPVSAFAAVMTCEHADAGCPFIAAADKRISITYEDPKHSDNTPEQFQVYLERSLQIAEEMFYVCSKINT